MKIIPDSGAARHASTAWLLVTGRQATRCCRRHAAGALVPELVLGHAVVVDSAVRDEGTSFHYLPPSRVADACLALP